MSKKNYQSKIGSTTPVLWMMCVLFLLGICKTNSFGQSSANYALTTNNTGSLALDANSNTVDMSTGTTQLVGGSSDDAASTVNNIGFDFWYMGVRYTQFSANSNGSIRLGATAIVNSNYGITTTSSNAIISPFGGDLETSNTGKVHFKTVGTGSSRCLVVEFLNIGLDYTGAYTNPDGTYQVRLYETTGIIEFVYGSMNINSSAYNSPLVTFNIGFSTTTATANTFFCINNTATNAFSTTAFTPLSPTKPVSGTTPLTDLNSAANGSRKVYTFTPGSTTAPSGVNFTGVTGVAMNVNWVDNASDELGYAIFRSTDNVNFSYLTTTAANIQTYAATGLSFGTTYYWKIFPVREALGTPASSSQTTVAGVFTGGAIPGIVTIGTGGDYNNLTTAFNAINAGGLASNIDIQLIAGYPATAETYPIVSSTVAAAGPYTIKVYPMVSGLSITSANTTGTLYLNGAGNITFDGRVNQTGAKDLVISNTNVGASYAILLNNDATNNTVKYCTIQSRNNSTTSGTVFFGVTTGANGSDGNTIDNCDIRDDAGNAYLNGIYASGTTTTLATYNDNNTISNCNIYNFFSAGSATNGVLISTGNNAWTVTGNSFYQTASRTYTVANTHTAINISSTTAGNNFTITNNFIGGTAPNAGGTAYTMAGAFASLFRGITLGAAATTASNIQGNVIRNFNFTTSSGTTTLPGIFSGINITAGAVNVGNTTANTVGAASGNGSITITSTTNGGYITGIYATSAGVVNIQNNVISSISTSGGAAIGYLMHGIYLAGSPSLKTVSGNTIGGATANSISVGTAGVTTGSCTFMGIYDAGSPTTLIMNNNIVRGNTVYSSNAPVIYCLRAGTTQYTLSGNQVYDNAIQSSLAGTTAATIYGFYDLSSPTVENITNNQIYNITANVNTTSTSSLLAGLYTNTTTGAKTWSGNVIYNFQFANAAAGSSSIYGMFTAASSPNIFKNKIYDLAATNGAASAVYGIYVSSGNTVTVYNNIIGNLTAPASSLTAPAPSVAGLYIAGGTTTNAYYNTINISGGGGANFGSAAVYASTSPTVNLRNNIFSNLCTPSGSGKAIAYQRSSTTLTSYAATSNNNLWYAGTPGVANLIYFDGTNSDQTVSAFKTRMSTRDQSSASENLNFVSTTGANAGFLHINPAIATQVESTGAPIATFTDDFDGDTRNAITPDMGADEFAGIVASVVAINSVSASPVGTQCTATARTITANITAGAGNITSVLLNYNYNGVAQSPIAMTGGNVSGTSNWTATLPAPTSPVNATVTWSVTAADGIASKNTAGTSYADVPAFGSTAIATVSATPVCSGTTTNLSVALSKSGVATQGAGSTTSTSTADNPFYGGYGGVKTQYIIRASELTALGFSAGNISALGLDVTSPGSTLSGFAVAVEHTALSALTSNIEVVSNTVFAGSFVPVSGINTITFSSPFVWNGTSNIIISFCWSNNNTSNTVSTVRIDPVSFVCSNSRYVDSRTSADVCSYTGSATPSGWNGGSTTTSNRPKFVITANLASTPTAISWSDGSTIVGTTSPLTVTPAVGTTSYTATVTTSGCPVVSNTVAVVVNPLPTAPTSPNSPTTQCGTGAPAVAVADPNGFTTPTYKWYSASTGGTLLQTSTSLTYTSAISVSTTFYVSIINPATGCESARTMVQADVNSPDAVVAHASSLSVCPNTPVDLTVTQALSNNVYNVLNWSAAPASGSGIATTLPGSFVTPTTVTPTAPGTYVYTISVSETSTGCATTANVSVLVNTPPVVAAIVGSTSVCPGASITLTDATASGVWSVTNGTGTASITSGGVLTGGASGSVTVNYAVTVSGCTTTQTFAVTVTTPPAAPTAVTATPPSICIGQSTNLNATSAGNSINWYSASVGGTLLGTVASGANYNVSPVVNTSYYAEGQLASVAGSQTFNYSGSIQTFTVPSGVFSLVIDAQGAEGGNQSDGGAGSNGSGATQYAGRGARIQGTIAVTPGQQLKILVGGKAADATADEGAGGGGGSFVTTTTNTPLIIAGGGGGEGADANGVDASITNNGTAANTGGAGGTGGNGGANFSTGTTYGSAGGGLLTNGGDACTGGKGIAFVNGATGGISCGGGGTTGGFGCAGGGSAEGAGGGGGYSGGGGADSGTDGGGGGGSYNSGTSPVNTAGFKIGNGLVAITWNVPAGCPSARTQVDVTAVPGPTIYAVNGGGTFCTGSSGIAVGLSNSELNVDYQLQIGGVNSGAPVAGTGSPLSFGLQTTVGTYTVLASNATCTGVPMSGSVAVTQTPLPIISTVTATPSTICSGSSTTLSAISGSIASGPAAVGAGASTIAGYVTTGNEGFGNPYNYWYGNQKTQYIFTQSELTAAGLTAGNITALSFEVTTIGSTYTMTGYTINIGHTAQSVAVTAPITTGLTQVYTSATQALTTGINNYVFSTPFNWNGTSNIVVSVCWGNSNSGSNTSTAIVKSDVASFNCTTVFYTDGSIGTGICAATSGSQNVVSPKRPRTVFTGQAGVNNSGLYNWVWTPGNLAGNIVTVSPGSTTLYTVTATTIGTSCTSTATVNVTVNPSPSAPLISGTAAVCGTGTTTLTTGAPAGGNTIKWYDAASGGNLLFTGASFTTPVVSATATYYAAEESPTCSSTRTSKTVTWQAAPAITITNPTPSFCGVDGITPVNLSASSSAAYTYLWSESNPGTLNTTSGASVTATITATTNYTVTGSDGFCTTSKNTTIAIFAFPSFNATASTDTVCTGGTSTLDVGVSSTNFSVASIPYVAANAPVSAVVLCDAGVAVTAQTSNSFTPLFGPLDDGGWSSIPVGFNFNYFGTPFNVINVGTNGVLQFGNYADFNMTQFTFSNFPSPSNPSNVIAVTAMDLDLHVTGSIKYWNDGTSPFRRFIIQYQNAPGYPSNGSQTMQCILYESTGIVEINVVGATDNVHNKTVGLQNGNGTIGASAPGRNNTNWNVTTPESWRFTPPINYTFSWTPAATLDNATSGTPVATPTTTTKYYVVVTDPITSCHKTDSVTITVLAPNAAPVTTDDSRCGAGVVNLTASGTPNLDWYDAATGGTLVYTGTNYSPNITSTKTYYVESNNGTCPNNGGRVPVTGNVTPTPGVTVTATPATVCAGANVQLVASVATTNNLTYCNSALTSGDYCGTGNGRLTNVTLSGTSLNNNSVCNYTVAQGSYTSYPVSSTTTAVVLPGQTYNLSVTCESSDIVSVWIDYDHSGTFDASEWTQVYTSGTSGSVGITIPSNSYIGATGMRVRSRLTGNPNGSGDACTSLGSGSTDDYTITIGNVIASGYTYDWTGNSTYLSATNIANPVAQNVLNSQTYTVIVSDPGSGCTISSSVPISVNPIPDPSISNAGSVCAGFPITLGSSNNAPGQTSGNTYSWSTDAVTPFSSTSSTASVTSNATVSNSGNYTVVITNSFLCTASATENVTVNPNPVLNASSITNVMDESCQGFADGSFLATASSGTAPFDYSIDGGNSSNQSGSFTGLTPGTYSVQVISDFNGCVSGTTPVTINSPNSPSTAPTSVTTDAANNNICLGNSVILTLNGGLLGSGATWKWYTGSCGGTLVGTGTSITKSPTATTTYFVRAEGAGCGNTTCASVTVTVSTSPVTSLALMPFTGMPANLCAGTVATLSIAPVSRATYYVWDAPTGSYFNGVVTNISPFTTTTPSVQVTFGSPSGSLYNVGVQAGNACGTSVRQSQKVRGLTSVPASVSGPTTACANSTVTYSTAAVTGATSYLWTVTGNATVSGTGTTATVSFGAGYTGGTVCVAAQTTCYTSPAKCITISTSASTLNAISGTFTACPNSTLTYSVPASTGAASYTWTLPPGATGSSTTNSINVTYGAGYSAVGSICVSVTSTCGVTSAVKCKTVAPGLPSQPASISGALTGLCNQTIVYSTPSQGSGITYTWTSPGTINTGQGSTSISTTFAALSTGNVCVTASNSCGSSTARCVPVKGAPNAPGAITATPPSWCANTSGIEFDVNTASLTGTYTLSWTFPPAAVATYVIGGGNSNSLILDWKTGSGNVNVTASNACGGSTKTSTWSSTCREGSLATVSSISVSPNPTTGILNINYTASKGSTQISVLDLAGRVVMTQATNSVDGANTTQLDMSKFAKGAYMLNVQSTQGNKQVKVVVE